MNFDNSLFSGFGHIPNRDITSASEFETSGWDRPSMKSCWDFLDQTSRSFSSVIKELDGDPCSSGTSFRDFVLNFTEFWLNRFVYFYLVLRGLDTVEDDMSILHSVKQPLLRSFHKKILTPGSHFLAVVPEKGTAHFSSISMLSSPNSSCFPLTTST